MTEGTTAEQLCSAIEETARMVGVPFVREKVRPVLDAYREALATGAVIFSIGGRESGELEYTVQVPGEFADPYERAAAIGFTGRTDHPVAGLLADIRATVKVSEFFVDFGVVGGFKKVYTQFPRDPQKVADLVRLPSAPPSIAAHADYFARHGLTDVVLIGIDYQHRTANLYFELPAHLAGNLDEQHVRAMLREGGMSEPSEPMLAYARGSYRAYFTLGWDSPEIRRISFAPRPCRGMDLSTLPVRLTPDMRRFMRSVPSTYAGELVNGSGVKWTGTAEHLDLASYHQITPRQLQIFDTA